VLLVNWGRYPTATIDPLYRVRNLCQHSTGSLYYQIELLRFRELFFSVELVNLVIRKLLEQALSAIAIIPSDFVQSAGSFYQHRIATSTPAKAKPVLT